MFGIIFKLFGLAIGSVIVVYLIAQSLRNARRVDRRIAEFKAEQEALKQQGKALDPYAALAELYAEEAQREAEARRKKRK